MHEWVCVYIYILCGAFVQICESDVKKDLHGKIFIHFIINIIFFAESVLMLLLLLCPVILGIYV